MAKRVLSLFDLFGACHSQDYQLFIKTYKLFGKQNETLLWAIQSNWMELVKFLLCKEKISPHSLKENLLSEAIEFGYFQYIPLLLEHGAYHEDRYIPSVICAIKQATTMKAYEVADVLLRFLRNNKRNEYLITKFGFDSFAVHVKNFIKKLTTYQGDQGDQGDRTRIVKRARCHSV